MFDILKDFRLAIFDLDGTLVQTHELYLAAARMAAVQNNIPEEIVYTHFIKGTGLHKIFSNIIEEAKTGNVETLVQQTNTNFMSILKELPELNPTDGTFAILNFFVKNQTKLALVSNSSKEIGTATLEKAGLGGAFEFTIFGDEVSQQKPDPEMYLVTKKHFNVPENETIVFEDSVAGAQGAAAAGYSPVIIYDGETDELDFPDQVKTFIDNFEDLNVEYDAELYDALKQEIENIKKEQQSSVNQ